MQRFENKYDLLNAAYKDPELKKGTIALLQYLVHKSNKEQCFPSVDTIAKALGVCRRTVQYNMRKLEKAGYIIRKDRYYNHLQMTNQYIFYFGITEDMPREKIYQEKENEMLKSFFDMPDYEVRKIDEIQKIYRMDLSTREKLLIIYLYHRADTKGMVYDRIQTYMGAIGVKSWTLQRILKSLRDKGLLKIKKTVLRGEVYLVIQLTGKVYHAEETVSEETAAASSMADTQGKDIREADTADELLFGNNVQKRYYDQNQEAGNIIHNIQKRIRKRLCRNSQFRILASRIKNQFGHIRQKVREILRI